MDRSSPSRAEEYSALWRDLRVANGWRRALAVIVTAAIGAGAYFYFWDYGLPTRMWAFSAALAAFWVWVVLVAHLERLQRGRLQRLCELEKGWGGGYWGAVVRADKALAARGLKELWKDRSDRRFENLIAWASWKNLKYYAAAVWTAIWVLVICSGLFQYLIDQFRKNVADAWHKVFH